MNRVTVLGGTSLVGHFLLPMLVDGGYPVDALSRSPQPPMAGVNWIRLNEQSTALQFSGDEVLISLAPIWVLGAMLKQAAQQPRRVIAFSSTSAVSKAASPDPKENEVARKLITGETLLRESAESGGYPWTILRPTMVYGAGLDQNVSTIARFIERFRFFPLLGGGSGLRMPVHAEDLATAVLACLSNPATENRLYVVAGGERLGYREMVSRIFAALGKTERTISIPTPAAKAMLALASRLPGLHYLTPEMAARTEMDLVFDDSDARRDFDYAPRPFHPRRRDILPA